MRIVPFDPFHLTKVSTLNDGFVEALKIARKTGLRVEARSFLDDDEIVGVAGINIYGYTAKAWAFLTDRARERPIFIVRGMEDLLRRAEIELGITRFEASALDGWVGAERLLKILGFEGTGEMMNAHGNTYLRYAR